MRRRLRPALPVMLAATTALAATPAVACEFDDNPSPHAYERSQPCESSSHGSGSWHHGRGRHTGSSWHGSGCDGGVSDNPPVEMPPTESEAEEPASEPSAPAEPVLHEPGAVAPVETPAVTEDTPVFTETIVSSTPLPTEKEELAETGASTALAIPCMVAAIAAGAGLLAARRRALTQ